MSVCRRLRVSAGWPRRCTQTTGGFPPATYFNLQKLKRAVLGKCEAGQCRTCGSFGNFHPDRWRIGSIHLCRAKHRILSKHFVVELGNQIILAIFVFAPDLPKLDGLNCHAEFLQNPRIEVTVVSSRVTAALVGVNAPK